MNKNAPYYETREVKDLKDMLNSSCELYGDNVAFLQKDKPGGEYKEIKFNEYKRDVEALGTALISLGLKDKNVAVIGENRYEWAVSYLAVVNGTGTVVPLDKELPEAELESLINRGEVSAIIYSKKKKEQIENIKKRIDTVKYYISMDEDETVEYSYKNLIKKGNELLDNGDKSFVDAKIDAKKPLIMLFTSGTTEQSKAVLLCHWNIAYDMMHACKCIVVNPEDRFFSVLPLHHTYECTAGFLIPLYRGASVAYCEGLRYVSQNLKEAKPTMILAVPALFENMYKKVWEAVEKKGKTKLIKTMIKISDALYACGINVKGLLFKQIHENFGGNLRIGIVGAAAMDKDVIAGFRSLGIHMIQGYGLTECSPLAALNRDCYYNDGAAGREVPGIKLKIDQPNAEGVGEICVQGDNVMLGYYKNEEATKKALKDGWLHTGDLGYFDEDGFLFITGRMKNVLITKNGKNVYPEELETLINKVEIIKESMVYQQENEQKDDTFLAAIIVPDFDKVKEKFGEISDEELKEKLWEEVKGVNKQLVSYKYIKQIEVRKEELEKTTTLKIKRYLVK
ncbi:MAG: AMP-binding protein [Clostridia bacterium]|nr:AMP-binding protein [Clostridia bacterium]